MKSIKTLAAAAAALTISVTALASELTIPNTFSPGQRAFASEVNGNFTAVAEAVNDNDARVGVNEMAITDNSEAIVQVSMADGVAFAGSNTSTSLNATDKIVRTLTISPPVDGTVVVNFSAWFNCTSSGTCVARCSLNPGGTTIDTTRFAISSVPNGQYQTLAITGALAATAGNNLVLNAVCDTFAGSGSLGDMNISASFSAQNVAAAP